jgi:hypothetical protein
VGSTAHVREWDGEEFWGVLSSVHTPGGCWFSGFDVADQPPYGPALTFAIGEQVELEWEKVRRGTQDGFRYRATKVRRI